MDRIHTSMNTSSDTTLETMARTLEGFAYAASLLFGLPIHCYVLLYIFKGGLKKITFDFIPLNQIVVEILLSLSGILYFCSFYLNNVNRIPFQLLSVLFLVKRPLVHSFICFEQYFATVHPVIFFKFKSLKCKVVWFSVSWLAAFVIASVGAYMRLKNYFLVGIGVLYVIILFLMAFCCFAVLRTLKAPGPGARMSGKNNGNKMKKRAFNLILFNTLLTIVSELPIAIMSCLIQIIPAMFFNAIDIFNAFVFVMTGFVPPILYFYREKKLHCKCRC